MTRPEERWTRPERYRGPEQVEHTELIVFGSQAIPGEYPEAAPDLRAAIEVDDH